MTKLGISEVERDQEALRRSIAESKRLTGDAQALLDRRRNDAPAEEAEPAEAAV